ncbi:MAG: prepilin-type N-terminal cleavage/methylation domain-containing protein [Eubacteriales bacterium]|nr:prepilin-type N-terminal cleavage/methylation domain-containing protein [Eubacteriales bacterium]
MNGRKGFTLAECAIALALIAVMSAAAFSTVVYAVKTQGKYERYSLALNKLDCLLACFKSGDFESGVSLLTGSEAPEDCIFYYSADGTAATKDSYSWRIEVDIEDNCFFAVIYDSGGRVIYKLPDRYVRGG